MSLMEDKLREYAQLLVQVGLNVQKGQTLVISAPVECAFFARICAEEAYTAGCREVVMNWTDDAMNRMRFLYAADEAFDALPRWQSCFFNDYALEGAAYLSIAASDPENLMGVDPLRLTRYQQARGKALQEFTRLEISGGFPWCVACIPIPSWARRVFPHALEEESMALLWDAIFQAVRVSGVGDCVEKWRRRSALLDRRLDKLNALRFCSLRYTNALGTNLTVQLPRRHIWQSCNEKTVSGHPFISNIPSEEIFTAPLKTGVDGVVCSVRPLVRDGSIIDRFRFVLREGKIVEARAERGEEVLRAAISADEGASYLGEVALVPHDSPISNLELLFYNTLFDENASCHFAFGKAYPSLTGGQEMTQEELTAHGLNDSITHVDFMVGTPDLSIVGTTYDGREIPVFVNGNFAAEL